MFQAIQIIMKLVSYIRVYAVSAMMVSRRCPMEGKVKLGAAILALALVAGGFLLSVYPTQAQTSGQSDTAGEEASVPYASCGGIQGCRTNCGCGCAGNPSACGCGG